MPSSRPRLTEAFTLMLRFGAMVALFYFHGRGKLQNAYGAVFQGQDWSFITSVGDLGFPVPKVFAVAAALSEGVASLLVAVGLLTRYAAAAVAFTMLVAVYSHLRGNMQFELAGLYLLIALLFIVREPGQYSVDSLLRRKRK